MPAYISKVRIVNFRNFKDLEVAVGPHSVLVGENKAGKTNFLDALRLILDPSLPDSARQLREEDFWDGIDCPMENGAGIKIEVDFEGFQENEKLLSILGDCVVSEETARLTYEFKPTPSASEPGTTEYTWSVYGGDDPENIFTYKQRRWMPLEILPALRDAERDLNNWRNSPLKPLIENLQIGEDDLRDALDKIEEATDEILNQAQIKALNESIQNRVESMIGAVHGVKTTLGIASTDSLKILRDLKLYLDGDKRRGIGESSLGICNVLYLSLLVLELERKEAQGERAITFLAIEEPEAHLHPHLQRLVFRDFLQKRPSVILTTHSPHIVSITPVSSLSVLRSTPEDGSLGSSTALLDFEENEEEDLQRYMDATRGEIVFAKGLILVEGLAELYLVPKYAELMGKPLDENGITVCSVHGTDFAPYVKLIGKDGLDIPFAIVTDGDPVVKKDETVYRSINRAKKIAEVIDEEIESDDFDDVKSEAASLGIFIGDDTLEIDLIESGNGDLLLETYKELNSSSKSQVAFEKALSEDMDQVVRRIETIGKGRFAQRLAGKLTAENIPEYISKAISHVIED